MGRLSLVAAFCIAATLTPAAHAQICPGMTLNTQAEVDAFNCVTVTGNLFIQGSGITNLNGLSELTSVGGNLSLFNNNDLTSITGLGALTNVGGTLGISANNDLTSLTGLNALTSVDGGVVISNNDALTTLTGLNALTSIGGSLRINNNDALASLTSLGALTSVGVSITIEHNDVLASLSGLGGITSLGGDLNIRNNDALVSLAGLDALTSIGVDLDIDDNDALTSLAGLDALTSVDGYLLIERNDALTSLSGLGALTNVGGELSIQNNSALTECACNLKGLATETSPGTFAFTGVGGTIDINSNGGPSCNSPQAVLDEVPACPAAGPDCTDPLTAPSYAGGYVLNSAQSRAFVAVAAPAGATRFEFYNTTNLNVGNPEADAESMMLLAGLTRSGLTFDFSAGSEPDAAFFPITTAGAGTGVSFFLRVTDTCGRTVDVDPSFAVTGVAQETMTGLDLAGAQPNPTSGEATIRFSLEEAAAARLAVYDVLGREVAVLVDEQMEAGAHEAHLNGASLPAGLYVYRLTANGRARSGTLTVAR